MLERQRWKEAKESQAKTLNQIGHLALRDIREEHELFCCCSAVI